MEGERWSACPDSEVRGGQGRLCGLGVAPRGAGRMVGSAPEALFETKAT